MNLKRLNLVLAAYGMREKGIAWIMSMLKPGAFEKHWAKVEKANVKRKAKQEKGRQVSRAYLYLNKEKE